MIPHLPVADVQLADLRARLHATRFPQTWPDTGDQAGTDVAELRRLVGLWAGEFDWRAREAQILALPWHVAEVSGLPVHYLRYDAESPGALPIVLSHGWPSSVLELTALAGRLAAPSRHGGRPGDAFTVIVPSLPGFGFTPQMPALPPALGTYELWHRLMHDVLGFTRYAAHGGDLGAGITTRLGLTHPQALAGIHVLAVAAPAGVDPASVTAEEQAFLDAGARWDAEEGAYQHQQMTRPLTLAAGLSDSPAGLLAWLAEKYRAWTDRPFSDDFVLTQASLYWFTGAIGTSFRPYHEFHRGFYPPLTRVQVPTAVAVFPKDLARPPRSWAERGYRVARYTVMPRGGHFAAYEEPALLGDDITAFFARLR